MERYEVNKTIENFHNTLNDLQNALDIDSLQVRLLTLNEQMLAPDFWQNANHAKNVAKEAGLIENNVNTFKSLIKKYDDLKEWLNDAKEEDESWLLLEELIAELSDELKEFEIKVLLSDTYDLNNVTITLHPGAGGTESQDWCEMLFRMYQRYASRKNFKFETLDYQPGEEAGIKSVTFSIKGDYAYGYLKSERGVHRLVRISPFDSGARRHTSFVSCDVVPEFEELDDVIIKPEELKVDVYRSSGAGGQSVNTTDSAVRITHIPTNIIVSCQNERSQIKNRETAMSMLKSKLKQRQIQERLDEVNNIKGKQLDIAWGSQIRSYVFQPYQLVKDHRTNQEMGNVAAVMDGDIDIFINAYLKMRS